MTGETIVQTPENKTVTLPKQRRVPKGSREFQSMMNANRQVGNKEFVEGLLNKLSPEERNQINRISRMPVVEYYTLPGHQLDTLHRLFRRVITLNRAAFLQAAADEYAKAVEAAKAKQAEAAVAEAAPVPEVPVSEPTA